MPNRSPSPSVRPAARVLRLGLVAAAAATLLLVAPRPAAAKYDAEARAFLVYKDGDVRTVLASLSEQLAIDPPPEYVGPLGRRVTLSEREVTLREALDKITEAAGLVWWQTNDDRFVVGTDKELAEAKAKGEVSKDRLPAAAPGPEADTEQTQEEQPAPPPVEEEPPITAVFNQGKIEQVLMAISQQAGVRITPEGKTAGLRVDVIAKDQPLTEVLDAIAGPKNLVWWKKADGSYGISDRAYYEQNVLPEQAIQRIFRPNHIKAEDFEKAIKGVLTPKIGKVAVDPRTNKVIVTDLPPVIEIIERLLQEIDVQLVTRVFQIHYADVEEIAKQIEDYKSGPGTIKVDPKTHQIVVTDLLQNILRMEKLIDVLDVGPEIVVYDVNNVGLDGSELEDLKSIIDSIRTQDLLFETNDMQGTFILEDVPEIHDKVEKILKAFDQPIKQVLIEGEVLTTTYSKAFGYQFDWVYSQDLLSAAADGLVTLPGEPSGDINIDGGYRNLSDQFPLYSSSTNLGENARGISITNLSKEALLTLQAAMNDQSTNMLLQPQLLVKNQEAARIVVGSEEPYLTTFYNNNYNTPYGNSTFAPQYVPSGLTLELTPSISPNGLVEMEVSVNDDAAQEIKYNAGSQFGEVTLYRRDRKIADTVLIIPNGETRMIGGLLKNQESEGRSGIPILAEIPIIGPLFGSYSKSSDKTNLMIFLTPTIVEEKGSYKVTHEGRRGRPLTLEEVGQEEGLTSPTMIRMPAEETTPSDEAESPTLEQGATLSGESAASQMPYLLGHEETTDEESEKKGPRTSSYTSTVGAPVGSMTDVTGSVTYTTEPGEAEPSEAKAPEETSPAEEERPSPPGMPPPSEPRQPPRPTPPPSEPETSY